MLWRRVGDIWKQRDGSKALMQVAVRLLGGASESATVGWLGKQCLILCRNSPLRKNLADELFEYGTQIVYVICLNALSLKQYTLPPERGIQGYLQANPSKP